MILLSLLAFAYAFYTFFSSSSGAELSLSLVRVAVAAVFSAWMHSENEAVLATAVLFNLAASAIAMAMMRKEVQAQND